MKGVVEPDAIPDYVYVTVRRRRRSYTKAVPARQHGGIDRNLVRYYTYLALYLYRRGDLYRAGRALGRAIHYVQDGVLRRTKWLVLDVHEKLEEEVDRLSESSLNELIGTCTRSELRIEASNKPREILCYAIKGTYDTLKWFVEELKRDIDKASVMKRVQRDKLLKTLIGCSLALIGLGTLAVLPYISIPLFIAALATAYYTPQSYWEAFKAGLMKIEPPRYETAM